MPFSPELRDFVNREVWTFAKTMPEWPHEYLVRERQSRHYPADRFSEG